MRAFVFCTQTLSTNYFARSMMVTRCVVPFDALCSFRIISSSSSHHHVCCVGCVGRVFFYLKIYPNRFCTLLLSFWSSLHISLHICYFTHLLGCSSRQNFLFSKIKNVFLFENSRKKVFVVTFYSSREKCPREERRRQQY